MTEARVGRLLAACLHEAIGELLPARVDFYEHWLHGENMRDGAIGLAPLTAVLGFLRTEGAAYHEVMARAGTLAAEWSAMGTPSFSRRTIGALPVFLRNRVALHAAKGLLAQICSTSRVTATLRRGVARVEIRDSLFCMVREKHHAPLCDFYAAALGRALALMGPGDASLPVTVDPCRAVDGQSCVLSVNLST